MKTRLTLLGFIVLVVAVKASAQFTQAPLPYNYNAMEPYIDEATMRVHYEGHHKAYVNNLNTALAKHPKLAEKSLEELLSSIHSLPDDVRVAIRNNAGGHYNHTLFWANIQPTGTSIFGGTIQPVIIEQFGSYEIFKTLFEEIAASRFGSGWVWLILMKDGTLSITTTPNQDNPLMDVADIHGTPLLALDLWEHAYYLKYKNKRAEYVSNFWNLVNWDEVNRRYHAAIGK